VHAVAALQDTADRELLTVADGIGVGSIDHFFPFQASAHVRSFK
jgi:hypothetical protein